MGTFLLRAKTTTTTKKLFGQISPSSLLAFSQTAITENTGKQHPSYKMGVYLGDKVYNWDWQVVMDASVFSSCDLNCSCVCTPCPLLRPPSSMHIFNLVNF